ncbi:MAG: hypothetical protein J6D44_18375 [Pseudomonas sp.]|nr:hypothetical protein [Pseudomonas sp.]
MKACTLFTFDDKVGKEWMGKFESREPLTIFGQKYLIDEISTDYEPGFAGVTIKMYPVYQAKSPERPKKQEAWDEGDLPPIGSVCEHAATNNKLDEEDGEWFKVEVIAHHKFNNDEYKCAVWVSGSEISYSSSGSHFRTIKTAEQLAEEEREKAIADMMEVTSDGISCIGQDDALALYKAGYRKQ